MSERRVPFLKHNMLADTTVSDSIFLLWMDSMVINQINTDLYDARKITFQTPMGNFYYMIMPFGLKKYKCHLRECNDCYLSHCVPCFP